MLDSGSVNSTSQQPAWLGKLILIKDFPPDPLCSSTGDYKLIRTILPDKTTQLDAVNVRPGMWTDLVVTLPDLMRALTPAVGLRQTRLLLGGLRVILYRPNSGQTAVLEKHGKNKELNPVPVVQMKDVVQHMATIVAAAQGLSKGEVDT